MGKFAKVIEKASQDDSPVGLAIDSERDSKEHTVASDREKVVESSEKKMAKAVKTPSPQHAAPWDERLSISTAVTGPVAESFRTLRARILYPPSGTPPKSILVTSAVPQEGKSFVCANLGIMLAQGMDNYSLIVDCDLRKPSIHKYFGLSQENGIVNYLRDGKDLGSLFVPSGVETLSVLPSGPPPVNPTELLGSDNMANLLSELKDRYEDRVIIIDSPPFKAASETSILAKHVDGVILVVRWGGSRHEHVEELVNQIGRDKIIGVVFNAYRATVLDTRVLGYYEYQHEYNYGENDKKVDK